VRSFITQQREHSKVLSSVCTGLLLSDKYDPQIGPKRQLTNMLNILVTGRKKTSAGTFLCR